MFGVLCFYFRMLIKLQFLTNVDAFMSQGVYCSSIHNKINQWRAFSNVCYLQDVFKSSRTTVYGVFIGRQHLPAVNSAIMWFRLYRLPSCLILVVILSVLIHRQHSNLRSTSQRFDPHPNFCPQLSNLRLFLLGLPILSSRNDNSFLINSSLGK